MKNYDASAIRNVVLLSHVGVGKTSLMESLCYTSGATQKRGSVDSATSIFDTRPDEKDRKMTISLACGSCEWKQAKVNCIDTPGFLDFQGDARAALRVAEAALLLVDASDGVQVGTEVQSRSVDELEMPKFVFVNAMDRENADFDKACESVREIYGNSVAPLTIPMGSGEQFSGVVDLVSKTAWEYEKDGKGVGKRVDIPGSLVEHVETTRNALMETIAESDEDLMNSYFEAGELSEEQLRTGLSKGMSGGLVVPLLCGSAVHNMGVDMLLDKIVHLCPSASTRTDVAVVEGEEEKRVPCDAASPTRAFVFKTISEEHVGELNLFRVFSGSVSTGQELQNSIRSVSERIGNLYFVRGSERFEAETVGCGDIGGVLKLKDTHTNNTLTDKSVKDTVKQVSFPEPLVSVAISAATKSDADKLGIGLGKLHEEDATFTYRFHPDIRQSILSAMGDIHIEIILENLKRRFKVEVVREKPKISYRETITKSAKYVEYTHKKQTGGAGQYARVFIDLDPLPRGEGYSFEDKIVGGVIDQPLRPSVDKGIRSQMDQGILAGYPIVDCKASLVDGKTHPVDSKDVAFQIAGREVFKKAFELAGPILLEPIADISVTVPDDYTGDIMGDLSSRRGKISGMNTVGKYTTINAKVPESEILTYSQTMRSLTQGRGFYTKSFSHYETCPPEVTKKIIAEAGQEKGESD